MALVCFASLGCGHKKTEVEISGKATMNGEPIDFGLVQFVTDNSEGGGNIQDGAYTAKVPRGELTVRVRAYRWTGPEPEVKEPKPGEAPAPPPQRPRQSISPESMWLKPSYTITVEKAGVYDLEFTSSEK